MKECRPITIVIADDDADDRQLTKEAFDEAKLANDLHFVNDGVELLDYLKRRGKYAELASSPRPGIILLDLNMPRMDGREALVAIKNDPELKSIHVIITKAKFPRTAMAKIKAHDSTFESPWRFHKTA